MIVNHSPTPAAAGSQPPRLAKKRFLHDAAEHVRDTGHRDFVRRALSGYYASRDLQKARFRDWEHARDAASLAKWSAVNRLDELLPRFVANFEANGGQVHWARDAEEARRIVLDLVRSARAKAVIKRDKEVDALNKQVHRDMIAYMMETPATITRALNTMVISKCLERVADHATNIAEGVIFMVSAQDVRHQA